MNHCEFCSAPCGERSHCDETCYSEHQDELKRWDESIRDELPVGGENHYGEWEPIEWDVVGGL